MYIIVGLGNPGEEYENTRHNAGRSAVLYIHTKGEFSDWRKDGKLNALVATGTVEGKQVKLVLPEGFMNKSGASVKPLITSVKKAQNLIVLHDDLDLPLRGLKISFNRGSGGHKGIESIARAIKTKAFVRVRIGVVPTTPTGKLRKPKGEQKILDFLMKPFKKPEEETFKKVCRTTMKLLETIVGEGRERAMNEFN